MPAKRPASKSAKDNPDIIIVSSDDDDEPAQRVNVPPRKKTHRQHEKSHVAAPIGDVLEVTSDEGGEALRRPGASTSVAELRKENSRLTRENLRLQRELVELRATQKINKKPTIDTSQLEDTISCEICALKMWNPYTLACGHTFCQSCLQDWLNMTLAQHMTNHPNYNANPEYPQLRNLPLHMQQHARAQLARMQPPAPRYTCPTCRQPVENKPAEAFTLKAMVRTIANAMGETSPRKVAPARRRGANEAREGPWDAFFPAAMLR